jgi:hypothetical protein
MEKAKGTKQSFASVGKHSDVRSIVTKFDVYTMPSLNLFSIVASILYCAIILNIRIYSVIQYICMPRKNCVFVCSSGG